MSITPELYPWFTVIAIAWGLLDCFLGYSVFKVTISILGGLAGAFAGHAVAMALGWAAPGPMIAALIGGLAGAGLAFALYLVAAVMAGFGFGFTLGILLLARLGDMVAVLGGCVAGLVAAFLAVKVQRVLIVLATALLGAFRVVLAGAYFADGTDWLFYFREPAQIPAVLDGNPWIFPSTLALATVGVISQLGLAGKAAPKPKKEPRS